MTKSKTPVVATPNVTETDRFGSRIGAQTSKINAQLSSKPQSVKQIADALGGASRAAVYNHLRVLEAKGHVKQVELGWVVASKAPAKKGKIMQKLVKLAAKKASKAPTFKSLENALNGKS